MGMMLSRKKNLSLLGVFLPIAFVFALYMYLGSFNRLLADDYCSIYYAKRLGLFRSIWFWYITWYGAFSDSVSDWFLSVLGPGILPYTTIAVLIGWIAAATIAVKRFFSYRNLKPFSKLVPLILGMLLVFTTLVLSPDISQSLFWWGGARGYLLPLVFFTFYIALYYYFMTAQINQFSRNIWLFVSFSSAFFIGGFSETFTPVQLVLFAGIISYSWLARKTDLKDPAFLFLSAGFIGTLFSLIVIIMAPGNSNRQTTFPSSPDIFTILRISFIGYSTFLSGIISVPRLLAAILGSTFGATWFGLETHRDSNNIVINGWQAPALLVIGFVLAFGCFPPAVYGTSESPPLRVLIIPAFFLVICFLASGFVFGEWLAERIKNIELLRSAFLIITCGAIIFSGWLTFRNLYLKRDEYISFAQKWDQTNLQIVTSKNRGLQEVQIPALKNWAGLEYPIDHSKYWVNVCYSQYYDIKVLAPPFQP